MAIDTDVMACSFWRAIGGQYPTHFKNNKKCTCRHNYKWVKSDPIWSNKNGKFQYKYF
jgi:hypothetical protein